MESVNKINTPNVLFDALTMAGRKPRKRPAESVSVPSAKKQTVEKENEWTAEEVSLTLTPSLQHHALQKPLQLIFVPDYLYTLRPVAAALPLL